MCRNDRGWRKLFPALTEAGKVSIVKKSSGGIFAGLKIRSVKRRT
jgi:hypothetical protein